MAPVSTTQTLVDAQQAHKELQARHTALKATYEVDERKHTDILRSTEALRTEQDHIRVEIAEELASAAKQLKETTDLIADAIKFLGEIGTSGDRHMAFVISMQALIADLQKSVDKAKSERETHHLKMVEEEDRLSDRKRDLDIYEKRLNDKIAKAGLQNEIKVIL